MEDGTVAMKEATRSLFVQVVEFTAEAEREKTSLVIVKLIILLSIAFKALTASVVNMENISNFRLSC